MYLFNHKDYGFVITEALKSRLVLILLQYVSNVLIPDHQPDVFHFTRTKLNNSLADQIIFHSLGGFLRWDAHYYVHISIYGYTYENSLAFFPFSPYLVGVICKCLHPIFTFISIEALVLFIYILLNIIIFIFAAITLYKLTYLVFNDVELGYKTVLLFCYNPASIFFIAPYTECLYSLFSFQIMLRCLLIYKKNEKQAFKLNLNDGIILVALWCSSLTRSNGIINIGFLIFTLICVLKIDLVSKDNKVLHILKYIIITLILSIISILPFFLHQFYCYKMFCFDFPFAVPKNVKEYGMQQNFIFPGEFSKHNQTWCNKKLPLAYSYVQDHYWGVGFLKYYEIKQIPNFILAMPILIILLRYSIIYISTNMSSNIFQMFTLRSKISKSKQAVNLMDTVLNVFVIHIFVLSIFCVLFVHIQVTTRMLCSASPVLYWYCATYVGDLSQKDNYKSFFWSSKCWPESFIKIYFIGYFIVGTVLFCNFLPWT